MNPSIPDISFVVTTRNSSRTLQQCLESLVGQVGVNGEILVIDNHSSDTTLEIAKRYAARVENYGPERSAQRNLGMHLSRAPVVVFVDSDMVLEPSVGIESVSKLKQGFDCLVIPETSFGQGYLARARALDRSLQAGNLAVEAARAYTRSAITELGGFDETLTGPEDWELHDRAQSRGLRVGVTEARIHHDEGSIKSRELFAKKRYYSTDLARYLEKSPHRRSGLIRRYADRSVALGLISHPQLIPGIAYLKAIEALAFSLRSRGARE